MVTKLAVPGQVLQVNVGDTIEVNVAFDYLGPNWRETLYAALYKPSIWDPHDEVSGGSNAVAVDIPIAYTTTPTISSVDIPVPNRPGETFGLYAKLGNILSQYCDNSIQIVTGTIPITGVNVTLKNPPSGATLWQLRLCDWDISVAINQIGGTVLNDVAVPITFEVPSGVKFPLRLISLQVSKWNADKTAIIVLYEIQSIHANLYDFDTGTYTGPPDPSYRAVFVPSLGSYNYNVATQQFESIT